MRKMGVWTAMRNQTSIIVRFGFACLAILLLSLVSRPIWAQVNIGLAEISGIVHDPAGAVVPNAQVVVSNPSKGVHLTLNTSGGGVFNAQSLVPASGYSVTVDKQGFSHYEVKNIELLVGQNLNIVVPLSIAGANAQIEVVGTAPLVDETKTDVSQVIGSQQILDLPINGRRVDTFVLLTPGVTNDGNFGLLTFRGVANGNNFLLDGNDSTNQFWVENNGRTRVVSQISQDAVQEFQVVSANYSAEYGRAMGGVVNTVTRSGTNDLHGTAYWFFRNQDFTARDPYSQINPSQYRLQSGASIGGPLIKDKLFFFINGDFTRINFPLVDSYTSKTTVIDPINQVFVSCGAAATPAPPIVATAAQCTAINGLIPRFFGVIPRTVDQDLAFGRIDYHLSENNTLSASFNFMHYKAPNGLQATIAVSTTGQAVNSNGNDYARVRNGKFTWTTVVGSNIVNQFRYGWNTDLEGDFANSALLGSLGLLDVSVNGATLGAINYLPRVEPNETRNEFADDVSWTRGRHIFKFGVDFATTNDYSFYATNLNGSYTYSNPNAFALDYTGNTSGAKNYTSYSQTFGNPALNTRINDYDFYVEDQWRATDRLTATIGARYEYSQLPQPTICNPAFTQTCHVNSSPTNLMPRIGLAYRLNDKTVLRAGYGIFFARMAGATLQDLYTSGNGIKTPSISLSGANIATYGPVFPNILSAVPAAGASTVNLQFAAPNLATPYTEQGSFAVERELMHDLGITVSYIWSRGVHLYSVRDLNLPTATTPYTYTIEDTGGNPVGTYATQILLGSLKNGVATAGIRPNTTIGALYEDGNGVTSYYNALTVQIHKRFSHGLMADLAYTWSHEIDDGQGYGQSTSNLYLSNNFNWLVNGDYKQDRGNGLEDQPQRLVLSWVWLPTFTHRSGAFYTYLVNNWELSSITTINSARPYGSATVSLSSTPPVLGMFSTFSVNGTGLSTRVPFWPVNSVWQPSMYRDDMRFSKIIPIKERYKLSLNFEIFNISNSWSPTSMTTAAYTESVPSSGPAVIKLNAPGSFATGSGDAAPPDGTEARRLQVSARFTF